jgi:hypothetical protein
VIACDVCGRHLLRGENPDVFLSGGQRRMVCELCVPRAAYEGWLREADDHDLSVRPTRARRAGSLLGRLRQLRDPGERGSRRSRKQAGDPAPQDAYGFLEPLEGEDLLHDGAMTHEDELIAAEWEQLQASGKGGREGDGFQVDEQPLDLEAHEPRHLTNGELKVQRAMEVFNAGDQSRRIAGVARSLGAPTVTVRPLDDSGSTVAIVVAWELCWYRYQVDLGDEAAGAQLADQGMELDELSDEDRLVNATADERGELVLLGV